MSITRQELGSMTLQRLAYILPQNAEEETIVKDVFETRARNSTYQTLTTIDVKLGWQEQILQKYINEKRENMPAENPASLTPEDEAKLDTAVITKETELELQAKLDAKNKKQKGLSEDEEDSEVEEEEISSSDETIPIEEESKESDIESEPVKATKKGRPKKK